MDSGLQDVVQITVEKKSIMLNTHENGRDTVTAEFFFFTDNKSRTLCLFGQGSLNSDGCVSVVTV